MQTALDIIRQHSLASFLFAFAATVAYGLLALWQTISALGGAS